MHPTLPTAPMIAFDIRHEHVLVAVIVFLITAVLRVLLPPELRKKLRGVALLLLSFGLAAGLREMPLVSSGLREAMLLVATISLTLAVQRLAWIIVVGHFLRGGEVLGFHKISHDIAYAGVTVVAALAAARAAGADPRTLATTGGLVTAGLTFSLQQTLGDLVAGILLQAQHPFDIGDWIAYDEVPSHIGKVIEINWRATKVVTLDRVEITVPNSLLAKASIVNFHRPTMAARRSIYFHVPYDVAPTEVQALVIDALRGADGILEDPAPTVAVFDYTELGVRYWLRFFLEDQGRRDMIDSEARLRVWFALRRAGVSFGLPRREIDLYDDVSSRELRAMLREKSRRREAIAKIDFLQPLGRAAHRELADRSRTLRFARGEAVVEEGSTGNEFYLVADGELTVRVGNHELARLGPENFFGEMSLLTGEPRSATVRAATDSVLYVIDKATFESVIGSQPEVLAGISRILAQRQAEIETRRSGFAAASQAGEARASSLLERMTRFFSQ